MRKKIKRNIMLIGNGFDMQHEIYIEFNVFINSKIFKNGISKSYSKFFKDEEYYKFSKNGKLWSDFEKYLKYIVSSNNLKEKYFIKKITHLFQEWINHKQIVLPKINNVIKNIISKHNINFIISLNYTHTPKIYGFERKTFQIDSTKSEWTDINLMRGKYILLHAFDSKTRNIYFILGHDKSEEISKNYFILEWAKKNDFNPKDLLLSHLKLAEEINKIVVYGFSFGESDKNINDFLCDFSEKGDVVVYSKLDNKILSSPLKDFLKCKNK